MARRRRTWSSLVAALRDPARSEFAFVPHQYVFAPAEVVASSPLPPLASGSSPSSPPTEATPINGYKPHSYTYHHHDLPLPGVGDHPNRPRRGSWRLGGAFTDQANGFFVRHVLALGLAGWCATWIALFPITPSRLYNMQVDVFYTRHEHAAFFLGPCLDLGVIFGAALAGYLGDRLGRAGTLELAAVPTVLGWLLVGLAYGEITVLIGRYLLGLGAGMIRVVVPIYLAEICAVHTRGRLLCVQAALTLAGRAIFLGLGAGCAWLSRHYAGFGLGDWKVLAMMGIFPALILLLAMQRLPDSPTWLIIRHDDRDAAFDVSNRLLSGHYERAEREVNGIIHAHILSIEDHTHHGAFFRPLLLTGALVGLKAVAGFFLEPTLSPTAAKSFAFSVLGVALDITDPRLQLLLVALLLVAAFIGVGVCYLLIDTRGRGPALVIGSTIVVAGCGLIALNAYYPRALLNAPIEGILDAGTATLLLLTVGHYVGLGIAPTVLVSELFPARQRIGAASLVCIGEAFVELGLRRLVPMLRVAMPWGQLLGLAVLVVLVANLTAIVLAGLYLPETSQRSLQAIEAILSGWYPETPQQQPRRGGRGPRVRVSAGAEAALVTFPAP